MVGLSSKTDEAGVVDDIDQLALDPGVKPDRLPPMLFLAALVHGILIIGITFNAMIDDAFSEAVSLEVTIVADPDKSFDRLDDAAYLAQASQDGGGNTDEQARPAAPLKSSVPVDNAGAEDGSALDDAFAQERSSDEVLTTLSDNDIFVANNPREEPTPVESTAALLEAGADVTLPLPQEQRANFLVRDRNKREIMISADTRESNIAGYVDRWKRKIESVGSRYLPEQVALQGISGSPTLEVTIDASGRLSEVIVRRTSGSKLLDQAALNILRRAAPFDPFPEAVRADHSELNFVYKWQFSDTSVASTASIN